MAARKNSDVEDGYTRLESPSGSVTDVPEDIKDALIQSGYKPVSK
jgi:hypothetical protein